MEKGVFEMPNSSGSMQEGQGTQNTNFGCGDNMSCIIALLIPRVRIYIKTKLNSQGANNSFQSARIAIMTTDQTKAINVSKSSRKRPCVDKSVDIKYGKVYFRQR